MAARVGDDAMGRFLTETLAREGCDVSHVSVDPTRLTAAVVLGIKDRDTFPLIFYRENCADMAVTEDDVAEDFLAQSKALLITGTHFSTPHVHRVSTTALERARAQRRAHRARHRLPSGAVGTDQARRRRDALHRERHGDGAPARRSCRCSIS